MDRPTTDEAMLLSLVTSDGGGFQSDGIPVTLRWKNLDSPLVPMLLGEA